MWDLNQVKFLMLSGFDLSLGKSSNIAKDLQLSNHDARPERIWTELGHGLTGRPEMIGHICQMFRLNFSSYQGGTFATSIRRGALMTSPNIAKDLQLSNHDARPERIWTKLGHGPTDRPEMIGHMYQMSRLNFSSYQEACSPPPSGVGIDDSNL
ncbi:hypothetical protein QL285_076914 [Trifolium repens]|nr:hypothetical protein QL285_076914 [Trifolium repens]